MDRIVATSGYQLDAVTGRVRVGIHITREQLEDYGAPYFSVQPTAEYVRRNPDFASNGQYMAMAFPASDANLEGLRAGVRATVRFVEQGPNDGRGDRARPRR